MKIRITDDFDLYKIADSGQCFRPKDIGSGQYLFIYKNNYLYIKQVSSHEYEISCDKNTWDTVWSAYFDLTTDYKKIRSQIPENDIYMKNAAQAGKGIRILKQDPFEMLISFIISQRKSIPAIRGSVEKICSLYGKEVQTEQGTIHLFPTPRDFLDKGFDSLTSCSLGYRLPYVTNAIEQINSGYIDLTKAASLSDEELLSYLMEIKGVGIKVASCIALFAYNRGEIAPVDVWIKRVIDEEYGGNSPFPGYKENSGIYQQYAFYAAKG